MKVLITGAAGYIGRFLTEELAKDTEIKKIFVLDKKDNPKNFLSPKVEYLKFDLAKDDWEESIPFVPDFVIHCAFDIRTPYARVKNQELNNYQSCNRVFNYCFEKNIKKLIYTSSAAPYGAKKENIGRFLTEEDSFEEEIYPYGVQKKRVEEMIFKIFQAKKSETKIFILRLATVNGKEGEKRKGPSILRYMKKVLPILPCASKYWARQYLNEEDLLEAFRMLLFKNISENKLEIFNLAPADFLTIKEISLLLNKKVIKIPIWFLRISFFLAWHLTLGYIPTCRGSYRSFVYPTNMDGKKITQHGFCYKYSSEDSFLSN